ncbi:GNAT family N-acetyltransferase [Paenibacillus marinisediminis]
MRVIYERLLTKELQHQLEDTYRREGSIRAESYFADCLEQNLNGTRITVVALVDQQIAGCTHLKLLSDYPHFRERGIPEINDLVVFPQYRRQGIANELIRQLEEAAAAFSSEVGIGVGLYADYGRAQRIYCRRGYILDGKGLIYQHQSVEPGSMVRVDDDLNLYFTKNVTTSENKWA